MNVLEDSFGRKFPYIRLSISDVCNFKCGYCLPDGYKIDKSDNRTFINIEEIGRLTRALSELGVSKIRLTGGEPTVRKDFFEIIKIIKENSGIKKTVMTTNGYRLDKIAKNIKNSGLDGINISIDSLNAETFKKITGHDRLEEILRGIKNLQKLNFKNIKINAVLLKGVNDTEKDFNDWAEFIKNNEIDFRYIELMQTGDNATFFGEQHVSGQSIKEQLLLDGWLPSIRDKTAGPAQEFFHPDYAGKIGLIMPYSKDFCATCNRLRVSAQGNLHLCLFSEQGLSLKEHLQSDDTNALCDHIRFLMNDKKVSHFLSPS